MMTQSADHLALPQAKIASDISIAPHFDSVALDKRSAELRLAGCGK
jgi:hypothetical protein